MFRDSIIEDIYDNDRFTIYSVIHPIAVGRGFSRKLNPRKSTPFGVDVIPGDPRLALEEDLLATDWSQATAVVLEAFAPPFSFLIYCNAANPMTMFCLMSDPHLAP